MPIQMKKNATLLVFVGILLLTANAGVFALQTVSAEQSSPGNVTNNVQQANLNLSVIGGLNAIRQNGLFLAGVWRHQWWVILSLTGLLMSGFCLWMVQLQKERTQDEKFSRLLLESQERERKRIAAELHDGLGQNLLIIKNYASLALVEFDDPAATKENLRLISEITSQAIEEARQIAYALRPYQIDRFGLTSALRSMFNRVRESSETTFRCEVDNLDNLFSKEAEINLYRIVQEGLNNILKHSQATNAELRIYRQEEHVTLRIADNGKGIRISESGLENTAGFGLTGLSERVRILGGQLELQTAPGLGTTINISIPLTGNCSGFDLSVQPRPHGRDTVPRA